VIESSIGSPAAAAIRKALGPTLVLSAAGRGVVVEVAARQRCVLVQCTDPQKPALQEFMSKWPVNCRLRVELVALGGYVRRYGQLSRPASDCIFEVQVVVRQAAALKVTSVWCYYDQ
jgi:hypothetical protein